MALDLANANFVQCRDIVGIFKSIIMCGQIGGGIRKHIQKWRLPNSPQELDNRFHSPALCPPRCDQDPPAS